MKEHPVYCTDGTEFCKTVVDENGTLLKLKTRSREILANDLQKQLAQMPEIRKRRNKKIKNDRNVANTSS